MISIDGDRVIVEEAGRRRELSIGDPEAFRLLSRLWLRSGWDAKYVYGFSWLGRPIIQLPEDLIRIQEVVYACRPDLIIETGIAHGGSLVFYAGLLALMGRGRVIGIDIEIRPHNRKAIEEHALFDRITLVEGDSTSSQVTERVRSLVRPDEKVMVILDANHTRDHVRQELEAYAPLVSPGCYAVVADGIMEDLVGAPRTGADWATNNPRAAASEFLDAHPEFLREEPAFPFNEGQVTERVTYWKDGFLRRLA